MNAGGIRQFRLLTVPDWKEKLLELLFDPDVRSYNRGFMEYDASIGGTCVFSHLDGDIARLIRFREAMQTGAVSFEVLCFDDQAHFLREYLGPHITLKPIDAAAVEAELGLERRNAFWINSEQQPSSPSPYRDLSPCFTWAECLANC